MGLRQFARSLSPFRKNRRSSPPQYPPPRRFQRKLKPVPPPRREQLMFHAYPTQQQARLRPTPAPRPPGLTVKFKDDKFSYAPKTTLHQAFTARKHRLSDIMQQQQQSPPRQAMHRMMFPPHRPTSLQQAKRAFARHKTHLDNISGLQPLLQTQAAKARARQVAHARMRNPKGPLGKRMKQKLDRFFTLPRRKPSMRGGKATRRQSSRRRRSVRRKSPRRRVSRK